MPNTSVQAAGEAMPTVSLESLVQQYLAAEYVANNLPYTLQDTPEEAALHAAVDAFDDVAVTLSSYEGMMQALRLAAQENEHHMNSNIMRVSVAAVLAFLEQREAELPVDRVERLARELSEALPKWAYGSFMAMVYPESDARGYWFRTIHKSEGLQDIDPIVKAINTYREGLKHFNALPDDDAYDDHSDIWKDPWKVLAKWDQPCVSRDGAIAAIKLAIYEEDIGESQLPAPMMRAALAYLEGAAA